MNEKLLEAYKTEIRKHYLSEREGIYSRFLLNPTRAKLRDLCVERFKNNPTGDDLSTFRIFFGFDFDEKRINRLKDETDKLRPIENFLKSMTDCNDLESLNLAAILLDFKLRPYLKFARTHSGYVEKELNDSFKDEKKGKDNSQESNDKNDKKDGTPTNTGGKEETKDPEKIPIVVVNEKAKANNNILSFFAKRKKTTLIAVAGLFFTVYTVKDLAFPEKSCMLWHEDHYILVNCKSEVTGAIDLKIPYNEVEFNRKKLKVCDTITFFKNNRAIVWYSKKNNVVEFFNIDGRNPGNGCELKEVSQHMIDKYVPPCK